MESLAVGIRLILDHPVIRVLESPYFGTAQILLKPFGVRDRLEFIVGAPEEERLCGNFLVVDLGGVIGVCRDGVPTQRDRCLL